MKEISRRKFLGKSALATTLAPLAASTLTFPFVRSARAAELRRVVTSLQDVDRRRDAYLTSIIRRYRDITSQFRAMSGMMDSSRDASSSACSSEALGRIQNTVSQADDDLRQLNELNAQARQLEKKLAKK